MPLSSMDYFAPSGSTRVSSNSPSSTPSSFDSTVLNTAVPFSVFDNDHQPHHNRSWAFDSSGSNTIIPYSSALQFGSPHAETQQAVGAAAYQCPSPPMVQLHNLSLSSSPSDAPCGPVTFIPSPTPMAPRPVSSSSPLTGRGWLAPLEPPPRPQMQAKIPPEKVRKSFPCLHPNCGMKFPKCNALDQHMRSHTGERPEVCEFCNRAFSLRCNLRRHYKTCKEKKALDAAMAIKKDASPSPPPLEQSPSPTASSPCTTAFATSPDFPPTNLSSLSPNLHSPEFNIAPSHRPSTLSADMNCDALFPTQLTTTYPYPTLFQPQY